MNESSHWTDPTPGCAPWCQQHRIDDAGVGHHHRLVFVAHHEITAEKKIAVQLDAQDMAAVADEIDTDEPGGPESFIREQQQPQLHLSAWTDAPVLIRHSEARQLADGLLEALRLVEDAAPDAYPRLRRLRRPGGR